MPVPEFITENPALRFTKEQVKKHPHLTGTIVAGLVFGGTMYDTFTYVTPIKDRARQEAYAICNYPSAEELSFARNLPSNASPIDRQRANQIDARVHGCSATATMLENKSLSDNGRPLHVLELLAIGISGALFGLGLLVIVIRRRATPATAS